MSASRNDRLSMPGAGPVRRAGAVVRLDLSRTPPLEWRPACFRHRGDRGLPGSRCGDRGLAGVAAVAEHFDPAGPGYRAGGRRTPPGLRWSCVLGYGLPLDSGLSCRLLPGGFANAGVRPCVTVPRCWPRSAVAGRSASVAQACCCASAPGALLTPLAQDP
ncbi:hypothetical protein DSL92_07950 [Billgrantia gudaonensis]|uniref:Uncharacterized protein n=1 Tax=Billgrantia gudaonensis TaxID=376427 RepID=A0A432JID9_9GAMM|nr:hypothetical protein DSL92_07950 [Halomonas gudaonensis]